MLERTATRHGCSENISGGRWRWLACGFPKQSKGSHKEQTRQTGGANWASALLAVVIPAIWFSRIRVAASPNAITHLSVFTNANHGMSECYYAFVCYPDCKWRLFRMLLRICRFSRMHLVISPNAITHSSAFRNARGDFSECYYGFVSFHECKWPSSSSDSESSSDVSL